MYLNGSVINVRVITDFLSLGNPTYQAYIRLDYSYCLLLEQVAVTPTCVASLTRCHRHIDIIRNLCKRIGIHWIGGFLVIINIEILHRSGKLNCRIGTE
ncbi:hypothetical protein D3C71_1684280 [compost metagenome]